MQSFSNSFYYYSCCCCVLSLLISADGGASSNSEGGSGEIDNKIRAFLQHRCSARDEQLGEDELQNFLACLPMKAGTIVESLNKISTSTNDDYWFEQAKFKIRDQCHKWEDHSSCQQRSFPLINRCFNEQQQLVYYFTLALSDYSCKNAEQFTQFWTTSGKECVNTHFSGLTKDFAYCLDRHGVHQPFGELLRRKLTSVLNCVREDRLVNCRSGASQQTLRQIMRTIEQFYAQSLSKSKSSSQANFSSSLTYFNYFLPSLLALIVLS